MIPSGHHKGHSTSCFKNQISRRDGKSCFLFKMNDTWGLRRKLFKINGTWGLRRKHDHGGGEKPVLWCRCLEKKWRLHQSRGVSSNNPTMCVPSVRSLLHRSDAVCLTCPFDSLWRNMTLGHQFRALPSACLSFPTTCRKTVTCDKGHKWRGVEF